MKGKKKIWNMKGENNKETKGERKKRKLKWKVKVEKEEKLDKKKKLIYINLILNFWSLF